MDGTLKATNEEDEDTLRRKQKVIHSAQLKQPGMENVTSYSKNDTNCDLVTQLSGNTQENKYRSKVCNSTPSKGDKVISSDIFAELLSLPSPKPCIRAHKAIVCEILQKIIGHMPKCKAMAELPSANVNIMAPLAKNPIDGAVNTEAACMVKTSSSSELFKVDEMLSEQVQPEGTANCYEMLKHVSNLVLVTEDDTKLNQSDMENELIYVSDFKSDIHPEKVMGNLESGDTSLRLFGSGDQTEVTSLKVNSKPVGSGQEELHIKIDLQTNEPQQALSTIPQSLDGSNHDGCEVNDFEPAKVISFKVDNKQSSMRVTVNLKRGRYRQGLPDAKFSTAPDNKMPHDPGCVSVADNKMPHDPGCVSVADNKMPGKPRCTSFTDTILSKPGSLVADYKMQCKSSAPQLTFNRVNSAQSKVVVHTVDNTSEEHFVGREPLVDLQNQSISTTNVQVLSKESKVTEHTGTGDRTLESQTPWTMSNNDCVLRDGTSLFVLTSGGTLEREGTLDNPRAGKYLVHTLVTSQRARNVLTSILHAYKENTDHNAYFLGSEYISSGRIASMSAGNAAELLDADFGLPYTIGDLNRFKCTIGLRWKVAVALATQEAVVLGVATEWVKPQYIVIVYRQLIEGEVIYGAGDGGETLVMRQSSSLEVMVSPSPANSEMLSFSDNESTSSSYQSQQSSRTLDWPTTTSQLLGYYLSRVTSSSGLSERLSSCSWTPNWSNSSIQFVTRYLRPTSIQTSSLTIDPSTVSCEAPQPQPSVARSWPFWFGVKSLLIVTAIVFVLHFVVELSLLLGLSYI